MGVARSSSSFSLDACRRNNKQEKRKRNREYARKFKSAGGGSRRKVVVEEKRLVVAKSEETFQWYDSQMRTAVSDPLDDTIRNIFMDTRGNKRKLACLDDMPKCATPAFACMSACPAGTVFCNRPGARKAPRWRGLRSGYSGPICE